MPPRRWRRVRGSYVPPVATVSSYALLVAEASSHHERNDQEGAWQLVHALAGSQVGDGDPDLANERALVAKLEETLAQLSGHRGEPVAGAGRQRVNGLPR